CSPCLVFLTLRLPPGSTLFPYTTLFRSHRPLSTPRPCREHRPPPRRGSSGIQLPTLRSRVRALGAGSLAIMGRARTAMQPYRSRSEEHTSELQSRENLVCRLLLEKKKKI